MKILYLSTPDLGSIQPEKGPLQASLIAHVVKVDWWRRSKPGFHDTSPAEPGLAVRRLSEGNSNRSERYLEAYTIQFIRLFSQILVLGGVVVSQIEGITRSCLSIAYNHQKCSSRGVGGCKWAPVLWRLVLSISYWHCSNYFLTPRSHLHLCASSPRTAKIRAWLWGHRLTPRAGYICSRWKQELPDKLKKKRTLQ